MTPSLVALSVRAFFGARMPVPNDAMVAEAKKGLAWREEFNRGGTAIGVARARDIINKADLPQQTISRMISYFARHEVDKQGEGWSQGEDGYPSAGRIAWALWGGDPGRSWANANKKEQVQLQEVYTPGRFIMCLLHAVTNAHILHLQSQSYAEHKALGKFYEDLGDLVDSVVEQWQGLNGKLMSYPIEYRAPESTAKSELEYMLAYVADYRSAMGDDSAIQNGIDEIAAFMQSTLYKLTFLK